MRLLISFSVFASLSMMILSVRADSSTGPGQISGEQVDERVLLAERLTEASKCLTRFNPEEDRDMHFQLVAFASRLHQSSTNFHQVSPDELLNLRRKLALKESEVKEHLSNIRNARQSWEERAAHFRKSAKGSMLPPNVDLKLVPPATLRVHEMGKKFEETAQRYEKAARKTAEQEARVAREVDVRKDVSRLLGEIAKELPAAKKQAQPAKK